MESIAGRPQSQAESKAKSRSGKGGKQLEAEHESAVFACSRLLWLMTPEASVDALFKDAFGARALREFADDADACARNPRRLCDRRRPHLAAAQARPGRGRAPAALAHEAQRALLPGRHRDRDRRHHGHRLQPDRHGARQRAPAARDLDPRRHRRRRRPPHGPRPLRALPPLAARRGVRARAVDPRARDGRGLAQDGGGGARPRRADVLPRACSPSSPTRRRSSACSSPT